MAKITSPELLLSSNCAYRRKIIECLADAEPRTRVMGVATVKSNATYQVVAPHVKTALAQMPSAWSPEGREA